MHCSCWGEATGSDLGVTTWQHEMELILLRRLKEEVSLSRLIQTQQRFVFAVGHH